MHQMLQKLIQSTWLRPFNEPMVWQAIAKFFNRDYRAQGIGAQVVQVINESTDCKSFVLKANAGLFGAKWPTTHLAGQHCVLSLQINGRRVHRSFSLSSAPGELLQITVKANHHAKDRLSVSQWMLTHLRPGSELTLWPPEGEFVLDNQALRINPTTLTLISAGSGITPIRAILRSLHEQRHRFPDLDLHLIHLCRDESDFVFGAELRELAKTWSTLTITTHFSAPLGRITPLQLCLYIGPERAQTIYFCGPSVLQRELFAVLDHAGYHGTRRSEHFGAMTSSAEADTPLPLELEQGPIKRLFTVNTGQNLLHALESAGARVASGCRIGICNTCQCLKRTGAVKNLRTGEINDAPNELIRLCVSAPASALSLSL